MAKRASRALWKGNWYLRKQSRTWRQPSTGKIASSPSGRTIGGEKRYAHDYSFDKTVNPQVKYNEKKRKYIKL